jgi:hypothetical protein
MFATIINDCRDANAFARQATSLAFYFPHWHINTVGIQNDIEAAFNLVDVLHSAKGGPGVILTNVAPRNGSAKKWQNGTPFGYFYVGKTLVIASVDGNTLSLVKKFGIIKEINLLDVPTVVDEMARIGKITDKEADRIKHSQFRSLEFIIPAARWLSDGLALPHTKYSLKNIPDLDPVVCFVDNFGNIKTSVIESEVPFKNNSKLNLTVIRNKRSLARKKYKIVCHRQLKDVKDSTLALTIGSSGYEPHQLLEIVIQGGSAAKKLKINSGTKFTIDV